LQQRDVIRRGGDGLVLAGTAGRSHHQVVVAGAAVGLNRDVEVGGQQVFGEPVVADGQVNPRDLVNGGELTGTQQRNRPM
jgi:hypothetical protein